MSNEPYSFDLVFAMPEDSRDEGKLLDAVYLAGFDDAVVGLGASGLLGIALEREGENAEAVIAAAIVDIQPVLPEGSVLREVRPDLVSLADVAARLRVTRQALQKRKMPAPSLGGLYRAAEIGKTLEMSASGKVASAFKGERGWFAASEGAQRINARIALGEFLPR